MTALYLACPALLLAQGMAIHTECEADMPALRTLFHDQRWAEFAMLPWDDATKRDLLDRQFDAQHRHYASSYENPQFLVLTVREQIVGRMYLGSVDAGDIHLIDILLAPGHRGRGIGSCLIGALLVSAGNERRRVLLQVDKTNQAAALYQRLGFRVYADTDIAWHMAWSSKPDTLL
jgi:ribosomal protein S18 acetylase RimI-like enzyme